jgi:hypothetical protein
MILITDELRMCVSKLWTVSLSMIASCFIVNPAMSMTIVRPLTQSDEQRILRYLEPWGDCITDTVAELKDGMEEPFRVLASTFDRCDDKFRLAQEQAREFGRTPSKDGGILVPEKVDEIVENVQLGLMDKSYRDVTEAWKLFHQKPAEEQSRLTAYLPSGGQAALPHEDLPAPSPEALNGLMAHFEPWRQWHECIDYAPNWFAEKDKAKAWLQSWTSNHPVIGYSKDSEVVDAMLSGCSQDLQALRYLLNKSSISLSIRLQERQVAFDALRRYQEANE